jgi:hypothetical protein
MSIARSLKVLASCFLVAALAACGTMPQGQSPASGGRTVAATTTQTLKVGAVVLRQSPAVDREVAGRNADQYFVPVRQALDSGRAGFTGATGRVTLTLRAGDQVFWTQEVTLENGYARAEVPIGTRLPVDAALCVETPRRIAHQRVRPDFARDGQHIMCTSGSSIYRFFLVDRRSGTYFVMAVEGVG